jgi:glutaredoxin
MLTVYSKANCAFCVQVKNYLKQKNIDFDEVRIDEDSKAKEFILGEGHRTVPQIYYNGQLFVEGGFQGLVKLTEEQIKEKLNVNSKKFA